MTLISDTVTQIKKLTNLFVKHSIVVDQNYPLIRGSEVVWNRFHNLSFALKDEEYPTLYDRCLEMHDYNFLLFDGAFIQLKYEFNRRSIVSHVLGYFPNPNIEKFQGTENDYKEKYYGNRLFSEVQEKHVVIVPFRFDYSSIHRDLSHPRVHATFGNYSGCRIPISKPLSPNDFIHFVLRNFYFGLFDKILNTEDFSCDFNFPNTISTLEKGVLHMHIEKVQTMPIKS
jgi:hypothetical protein